MSQMTKRALVASLKDLLAETPLDKITVTDLTEHCGVNRMTFYYHFKDIYDLVEWACIESATRALAGQKTYDTWQQGFLQILQAVQKDKVFVTKVYHSISREHIENYLPPDLRFNVRRRRGKSRRDDRAPRGQGVHCELLQVRLRRPDAGMGPHRHEGRPRRPGGAGVCADPRGYHQELGNVQNR